MLGSTFEDVAAYQITTDTTHLVVFGGANKMFGNGGNDILLI